MADELIERKNPTSSEVLSNVPKKATYGPEHGSGNLHLNAGELRQIWHDAKPAKPSPKK
jgi:hypothetical protein